jgi:triacylglycerol lipase
MKRLPASYPSFFDIELSLDAAKLVQYAYAMYDQWTEQHRPRQRHKFSWAIPSEQGLTFGKSLWSELHLWHFFSEAEPFAFVAEDRHNERNWLVFRGTKSKWDWLSDAESDLQPFDGGGKAHHGFLKLFNAMRTSIEEAVRAARSPVEEWVLCGHSLGSTLATLACFQLREILPMDCRIHLITFGSPRVGDIDFSHAFEKLQVKHTRVINSSDVVPTMPPSVFLNSHYQHVGSTLSFTWQRAGIGDNHSHISCYLPLMHEMYASEEWSLLKPR